MARRRKPQVEDLVAAAAAPGEDPRVARARDRVRGVEEQGARLAEELSEAERAVAEAEEMKAGALADGADGAEAGERLGAAREQLARLQDERRICERALEIGRERHAETLAEVRAEILEGLRSAYAEAARDFYTGLLAQRRRNDLLKAIRRSADGLSGRTVKGGTATRSGVGTGGQSSVFRVGGLPDLAWKELSHQTPAAMARIESWKANCERELRIRLPDPEEA